MRHNPIVGSLKKVVVYGHAGVAMPNMIDSAAAVAADHPSLSANAHKTAAVSAVINAVYVLVTNADISSRNSAGATLPSCDPITYNGTAAIDCPMPYLL
jgi:hypothetical protein